MKRDMDLIRLLLLKTEGAEPEPDLSAYTEEQKIYHSALLIEAGLTDGQVVPNSSGVPAIVITLGLKWAGHDFLDAARDNTVWKKAKEKVFKPGVSWTFSLLLEWLKQEAHQRIFGTPPQ